MSTRLFNWQKVVEEDFIAYSGAILVAHQRMYRLFIPKRVMRHVIQSLLLLASAFLLLLGFYILSTFCEDKSNRDIEIVGIILLMAGFFLPILALGIRLNDVALSR